MSPPRPAVAAGTGVVNGGFESGDFTGWTVVDSDKTMGSWFVYSGTTSPVSESPIAAPPEGSFAATSDQMHSGSHLLFQDVMIAPGTTVRLRFAEVDSEVLFRASVDNVEVKTVGGVLTLSFILYYVNDNETFFTPATLDFMAAPNQQYRVDIMDPSAAVASVAPGDVLANVFQTKVGDPPSLDPTTITFDLTALIGPSPTPSESPTGTATATFTATPSPSPTQTEVETPPQTPTATSSPSPTQTEVEMPPQTPTETPTVVPTATPTATPCVGDCGMDGMVTVDELLTMVNVALGLEDVSACSAGDANGDKQITVDEILAAVSNALNGCTGAASATA